MNDTKKYYTTYEKLEVPIVTQNYKAPVLKTTNDFIPTMSVTTTPSGDRQIGTWFDESTLKRIQTPVVSDIANLSFTDMVKNYGQGVMRIKTTNLRDQKASYGVSDSKHKQAHPTWKNEDGTPMPMAFDVSPTAGHTFKEIFAVLGRPEWQLWLRSQNNGKGWGIIDESTPEIRSQHPWKSTGDHIHIGADAAGWKNYVEAMKKYNNLDVTMKAEKGGTIKEKTMEIIIEKDKKEEDALGCLLCQIMNALGLRHHALSETKTEKLSDILGGDAQIIIEIGGPDKVEDSFESLIKEILPLISSDKKYSEEDIAEIRKDKEKQGESMKKLLTLMSDGNILKAFNGMQLFKAGGQIDSKSTVSIKIGGKEFNLYEAKTDEEKEKGLMEVKELKENEGMIFYYDSPQEVSFWMKDTEIPLDICFFNEDEECISVKQGHPLSEDAITEKDVMFVVEVPAGSDIKPGDELDFPGDDDEYVMHVLGSDGNVQFGLYGGERICSRRETKVLIKKAKRAYKAKGDYSYDSKCKSLGKYIFKVLDKQDARDPEYVQLDSKKSE